MNLMSIFEQGLEPRAVNHIALSPLSFIERTASVYPDYPAVIHGSIRRTWLQTSSAADVWRAPWQDAGLEQAIP